VGLEDAISLMSQLGVKNGPDALEMGCLFYPRKQTSVIAAAMTRTMARPINQSWAGLLPIFGRDILDSHRVRLDIVERIREMHSLF
jgi:hypothetical protein